MKIKKATSPVESAPANVELLERTVKKLLSTPPVKIKDMKKVAAPKRAPHSSGKGAKG